MRLTLSDFLNQLIVHLHNEGVAIPTDEGVWDALFWKLSRDQKRSDEQIFLRGLHFNYFKPKPSCGRVREVLNNMYVCGMLYMDSPSMLYYYPSEAGKKIASRDQASSDPETDDFMDWALRLATECFQEHERRAHI